MGDASELLTVLTVRVGPNMASVTEPLDLNVEYALAAPVASGSWHISWVLDVVRRRNVLALGHTEPEPLAAGRHVLRFKTPPVDVSGLRPSQLTNAGVLVASLRSHAPPAAASGAVDAAAGGVSAPSVAAVPVAAAGAAAMATASTAAVSAGDSGDAADAADGSVEIGSVQLVVQALQRGDTVVRGILNPWDDGTGTA